MNSIRRIAHLDMDAFFASVELLRYPELRGQAVVVGGRSTQQPVEQPDGSHRFARLRDYAGRGVITTSTYEARALGVFSGMGLMKSAQLAPDAILLPANFDAYREYSRKFKDAVATIAPTIEDRGIDEIYIDLGDIAEETHALARRIKQAVFDATGLSCSIGVSPNKLLSKICSDLDKPDGITVLGQDEIAARIWPLAAKKINGIGPKASAALAKLGINTIGELAATPVDLLANKFGRTTGAWLHRVAHGRDERPIVTQSEPKSISSKPLLSATCTPGATAPSSPQSLPRCAGAWPTICSARGMPAGPSASSCATPIFMQSRATSRCPSASATAIRFAGRPASASGAFR